MCQFGNETKILEEVNATELSPLFGWRDNYIIGIREGEVEHIKSYYQIYEWPKDRLAQGLGLDRDNSLGIYSYNYYNYNYSYNDNNYNNNDNYYIQMRIRITGKVFVYKEGYRSEFAYPSELVILDKNSRWFEDEKTKDFANHFNSTVEAIAKEYNCGVIEWSERQ